MWLLYKLPFYLSTPPLSLATPPAPPHTHTLGRRERRLEGKGGINIIRQLLADCGHRIPWGEFDLYSQGTSNYKQEEQQEEEAPP